MVKGLQSIQNQKTINELKEEISEDIINYINNLVDKDYDIFVHRTPQKEFENYFSEGLFVNSDNIEFTATNCQDEAIDVLNQIYGAASYKQSNSLFLLKIPKSGTEYVKGKTIPIMYSKNYGNYILPQFIDSVIDLNNLKNGKVINRREYMKNNNLLEEAKGDLRYNSNIIGNFSRLYTNELLKYYKKNRKKLEETLQIKLPRGVKEKDIKNIGNINYKAKNKIHSIYLNLGKIKLKELLAHFKIEDLDKIKNKDGTIALTSALYKNKDEYEKTNRYLDDIGISGNIAMNILAKDQKIEKILYELGKAELRKKLGYESFRECLSAECLKQENQISPQSKKIFSKIKEIFNKNKKMLYNQNANIEINLKEDNTDDMLKDIKQKVEKDPTQIYTNKKINEFPPREL